MDREPPSEDGTKEVNVIRASENRADILAFRDILEGATYPSESHEMQFEEILVCSNESDHARMRLAWTKEKANVLLESGQYQEAIALYKDATRFVLGEDTKFLALEADNEGYKNALASKPHINVYLDLIFCFDKISEAYLQLQDRLNALNWLQDLESLYEYEGYFFDSKADASSHSKPRGWLMKALSEKSRDVKKPLELCTYRMEAALRFARIFAELNNTGAAMSYAYLGAEGYPQLFRFSDSIPEISEISTKRGAERIELLKHPDINTIDSWDIKDPDLQIRGIWTKVTTQCSTGFRIRDRCASWIWKSKLYIFLKGDDEELTYHIWYLDLKYAIPQRRWRWLSKIECEFPKGFKYRPKAAVYNDCVWFFNGNKRILFFHLVTEKWDWGSMDHPQWPYAEGSLQDFCFETLDGTLHIFGGRVGPVDIRANFVSLTPADRKWVSRNIFDTVSPREASGSWIVAEEKRLYIMLGSCTHYSINSFQRSESGRETQGSFTKEFFSELWSYSIDGDSWRKESVRGNFPSPREHMSSVYHAGLKSVIAFGGSGNSPRPTNQQILHSDTFIMDIESRCWRQVVTRNFPPWRGQGELLVDDATGNIYMFGGCAQPAFLFNDPKKDSFLSDIWQLHIDLPGCHFDLKEFYNISPFLKVGRWRRCYACKSIGTGYFRCQGTCRGKNIFCSVSCHRKAWSTHRTLHGCHKI